MLISLIGSGNVAKALGIALKAAGHRIFEIHSRNAGSSSRLNSLLQSKRIADISKLSDGADLYIIAVDDDAISEVVQSFPFDHKPVVHTSGITAMNVLKKFRTHGVFYPLNTFSTQSRELKGAPVLIEGSTKEFTGKLKSLAQESGCTTHIITTENRRLIHLAAVFANNFSNALFTIAFDLLKEKRIPFDLLKPLVQSTIENAFERNPADVQTGPAKRGDKKTMKMHLKLLSGKKDAQLLYKQLSAIIEKGKA